MVILNQRQPEVAGKVLEGAGALGISLSLPSSAGRSDATPSEAAIEPSRHVAQQYLSLEDEPESPDVQTSY